MQAKESKESFHCFPSTGRCSGTPRKTGLRMVSWEDKRHHCECLPHPQPTSPQLLLLSTMSHVMGHPFGHPGPVVLAVSPPSSWCTPSFLAGRAAREAEESLALCKHCSAQLKHLCVITTTSIKSPKCSIIQTSVKKTTLGTPTATARSSGSHVHRARTYSGKQLLLIDYADQLFLQIYAAAR